MPPTVAEVVDLVVRLEDDPARRHLLDGQPYGFFCAAVDDGLVSADAIESFAIVVGYAVKQGAMDYRAQHGGVMLPPLDAIWTDHAFQSRIGYHSTLAGQQMAALYQQRHTQGVLPVTPEARADADTQSRDIFISYASEDKDAVAVPLSNALVARGWTVWLDERELTVGDSLNGHIEAALARSRFGVVVLSPASFAKEWPQRELAGLTAREVDAGTKVILPVWHEVDRHYVVQRAPVLADRLGALTSAGIEDVANRIAAALERAGMRARECSESESVVQSVEPGESAEGSGLRLLIPTTPAEQTRLVADRPDYWEWRLFAGVLVHGKNELETKWDDHILRLPRGARREVDQASVIDFLSSEIGWMGKQVGLLDRILSPSLQNQAFGSPGQPGDPARIEALSRRLIEMYESLLDWAATLRATMVPEMFEEMLEVTACFVDAPIVTIREFVDMVADQIARVPEVAVGGTEEKPAKLLLEATLALDPAVQERHERALEKLRRELSAQ
jgi:hypothetical protein